MVEKDYKNKIEAILFSSGRYMDIDKLMSLTGASSKQVIEDNVKKLKQEYESRESPLLIVQEKDGWKINVREKYLSMVRKIVSDVELPKTVLETLAVIALQSPVLQSKVVDIRHNKAYNHIKELDKLGFISKTPEGRTYILKLTNKFFDYFEVDSKKEIRELFREVKTPEIEEEPDQEELENIQETQVHEESKKESIEPEEPQETESEPEQELDTEEYMSEKPEDKEEYFTEL